MKCYKVQMMTHTDFCRYMDGSYNYTCKTEKIIARNEKEAIEKAEYLYPSMVINKGYIRECKMPKNFHDQLTIVDL